MSRKPLQPILSNTNIVVPEGSPRADIKQLRSAPKAVKTWLEQGFQLSEENTQKFRELLSQIYDFQPILYEQILESEKTFSEEEILSLLDFLGGGGEVDFDFDNIPSPF